VWSIDPQHDHLGDLAQRMRRFAGDVLSGYAIRLQFDSSAEQLDLRISAGVRRHAFLIFKECVHNMVRHSGCRTANIQLAVLNGWLILRMQDDGQGFDASQVSDGHGLRNMRERARALGGQLELVSAPGCGVAVTFRSPLR
jgi:signal transduction histidine kinase